MSAGDRCEYWWRRQDESPLASLHIEHIRRKKHRGTDALENLALACADCNAHKGSDVAGYDPESEALTELFNRRCHVWSEHFAWHDIEIVGITAIGRTTVAVLHLNSDEMLKLREASRA